MDRKRVKRVVVVTDFSEQGDAVLEDAIGFARLFNAAVDLVHVNEPFVYTLTEGFVPSVEHRSESARRIDERLAALADRVARAGLRCVTTSLDGVAYAEIVRHRDGLKVRL